MHAVSGTYVAHNVGILQSEQLQVYRLTMSKQILQVYTSLTSLTVC